MKKLTDFQAEKVEIKTIYGGLANLSAGTGTRAVEQCQCSQGHWHTDHVYLDA